MITEKRHTILYVDDEESNLRIFKNTFRREYNIVTASSGEEGLKVLDQEKVDLILTDQKMPGMSGVDFLKRAIVKYPELNRIIVTAYSDYDILREAVNDLKIFQYVEKPWRQDEIKVAIDSALQIYTLRVENQKLSSDLLQRNNELLKINQQLNEEIERHKQTQVELIKEKEIAEKSNQLKSAFLANMSHEVRTPMNSIMGFVELLKNEDCDDSRYEYMTIIDKSCNQLLHIIDDIIEISKIETGNTELKPVNFNVNELLRRVHKMTGLNSKPEISFEITSVMPDDFPAMFSDEMKIQQVLINLINNAFKFTHKGHIEIGARLYNESVLFFVKDSGVGISEENHEVIFQRFRQLELKTERKYGGNGLGLAISKGLVEKMSGQIWVESEVGKGSAFYFTIPVE